ncbi:MAG: SBBP repeat-containing protein [Phycisphaerales bacterium JB039]
MRSRARLGATAGAIAAATGLLAPGAMAEQPLEVVWGKLIGTPLDDLGFRAALDPAGNLVIAGWIGIEPGRGDALLAKYSPSGALLWSRQIGTTANDMGSGVAVDAAGAIYLAGRTSGRLFGPHAGSSDAFLAKYDASGELLWGRQFGTSTHEWINGVVADGDDVYVCGDTGGSLFAASAGSIDCFLARYDASGQRIWERQFGTALHDSASGIAMNAAGDLITCGWSDEDPVVRKHTPGGADLWLRRIETPAADYIYDLALDGAGGILIVGDRYHAAGDQWSALLMKCDADGALLWTREYDRSGSTDEMWRGVTADFEGNAYVCGGSGPSFGYEGPNVMLLSKYDPSGNELWLLADPLGARESWGYSLALRETGELHVTGYADRLLGIPGAGAIDAAVAQFRPACYPDCDGSGELDLFDFLCFQNAFASGDPYADCDGTGALDLFDFLCFQNEFATGCPR